MGKGEGDEECATATTKRVTLKAGDHFIERGLPRWKLDTETGAKLFV